MLDGNTAPQGAEGAAASEPQPYDDNTAAERIRGLLGGADETPPQVENSGEEPDTGDGESHPTGEEEGHSEPQDAKPAAIEPPKSWSDEEKTVFGKLPPEVQQVIAGRESERDKAFTQKTQEVAEQRKAVEAHTQAIQQERAQVTQAVQTLAATLMPELAQFQNVDWAKLAAENPAEYVRLKGAKDSLEMRLGAAQQLMQGLTQRNAYEQQQGLGQRLAEEAKVLAERIPEFADEAKKVKLAGEIRGDLTQRGFSEQEIGGVTDHRLVEVAVDAMRWRQHQASLKAAQAKATAKPAPRVQQPGTAQGRDDGATQQVRDLRARHTKNGDLDSGAALIRALGLV